MFYHGPLDLMYIYEREDMQSNKMSLTFHCYIKAQNHAENIAPPLLHISKSIHMDFFFEQITYNIFFLWRSANF